MKQRKKDKLSRVDISHRKFYRAQKKTLKAIGEFEAYLATLYPLPAPRTEDK